jgi:hypothetical protein
MKTTSLADLVASAQAAANKAFAPNADGSAKDALAVQTLKLEEFATANFDRLDFANWENAFFAQLEMLVNFSKQDSPATKAAKLAAAKSA